MVSAVERALLYIYYIAGGYAPLCTSGIICGHSYWLMWALIFFFIIFFNEKSAVEIWARSELSDC